MGVFFHGTPERGVSGYEPEEIIGKNFSNFFTLEDQEAGVPRKALEEAARVGLSDINTCETKLSA
jgi:hypothetical protein